MPEDETLPLVIPEDELFEVILTTENAEGQVNAAPVGVVRRGNRVIIELSASTLSLENLRKKGSGLLNLVSDPLSFAESAFGIIDVGTFVHESPVKRLPNSRATIPVSLHSCENFVREDRLGATRFVRLALNIEGLKIHAPPEPYSRKRAAAIEAVVAVTKAEVACARGLTEILDEFGEKINRLRGIAGGPDGSAVKTFEICVKRLEAMNGDERNHE